MKRNIVAASPRPQAFIENIAHRMLDNSLMKPENENVFDGLPNNIVADINVMRGG